MLSLERIIAPQRGQCERGWTMDSWRGRREMQTLRKLPKARPKTAAKMPAKMEMIGISGLAPVQL
jgi:hypothetical protein